jgi:DNA modification methylase
VNYLYFGDNLEILRRFVKDESVDLIYLDPPFNSKRDYNAVFTGKGGQKAAAQIQAFEDTWHWDDVAAAAYEEVVFTGTHTGAAEYLKAMRALLGTNDMLAYLTMMTVRMVELHRVLKPTGSIYLHCDPTMSAHLRLMMDAIFDVKNFRNEIIWKRTHAHSGSMRFGPLHDVILFYGRGSSITWNPQYAPYSEDYIETFFKHTDNQGRRYRLTILTGSGTRRESSGAPWRGIDPTASGRHWAVPGYVRHLLPKPDTESVQEALDQLDQIGRIYWPKKKGGKPSFIQYLDDMEGTVLQDLWTDIKPIASQAAERLGYPTQKPLALLERIINASSNEGDVVLDPFCGCGTTITAAQKLNRNWIGIDITHLAVNLMRTRLIDTFGDKIRETFKVIGEPTTHEDAVALAENDKYQFQFWSLGLVGARPESSGEKKGADKGVDGKRFFSDEVRGTPKTIIFSVKGGQTIPPTSVRDLRGTIEREGAEIGVLISLVEPTRNMREEAAAAGFYTSAFGTKHKRIQLYTIDELLNGAQLDLPSHNRTDVETFKRAKRVKEDGQQEGLGL